MSECFDSVISESVMRCEYIFDITQLQCRFQLFERSYIQSAVKDKYVEKTPAALIIQSDRISRKQHLVVNKIYYSHKYSTLMLI